MSLNRSARLAGVFDEAADTAARHALGALAWQVFAACGARDDLPWTAESVSAWEAETMRSVCAGCPVLTECATYAASAEVCAGWWAGRDMDPDHVEPTAPAWVPMIGRHHPQLPAVEQGVLPLGGAA